MIGMLSGDEVEGMLRRHRTGRIGCAVDDHPYVVPITYAYDGRHIYACSALGRKIEMMRAQPRVCFEIDEIDGPSSWLSVIAEGVYEELADEGERRVALERLAGRDAGPEPIDPSGTTLPGTVVFRLRLTSKAGRFERRDASHD